MNYTSNPTAADQTELTALLNEERHARTLANIARRAENLWADGYTVKPGAKGEHFAWVDVRTPAGDLYLVCLSDLPAGDPDSDVFGDSCTCPAFAKYGDCKHHLAVLWLAQEQAQADAFDTMMAEAETPNGCDPYARF